MTEVFQQGLALKVGESGPRLLGALGQPALYTGENGEMPGVEFMLNGRRYFQAAGGKLYTVANGQITVLGEAMDIGISI